MDRSWSSSTYSGKSLRLVSSPRASRNRMRFMIMGADGRFDSVVHMTEESVQEIVMALSAWVSANQEIRQCWDEAHKMHTEYVWRISQRKEFTAHMDSLLEQYSRTDDDECIWAYELCLKIFNANENSLGTTFGVDEYLYISSPRF